MFPHPEHGDAQLLLCLQYLKRPLVPPKAGLKVFCTRTGCSCKGAKTAYDVNGRSCRAAGTNQNCGLGVTRSAFSLVSE